jgi:hypothetical protein
MALSQALVSGKLAQEPSCLFRAYPSLTEKWRFISELLAGFS